jgi:hypothetical protein
MSDDRTPEERALSNFVTHAKDYRLAIQALIDHSKTQCAKCTPVLAAASEHLPVRGDGLIPAMSVHGEGGCEGCASGMVTLVQHVMAMTGWWCSLTYRCEHAPVSQATKRNFQSAKGR